MRKFKDIKEEEIRQLEKLNTLENIMDKSNRAAIRVKARNINFHKDFKTLEYTRNERIFYSMILDFEDTGCNYIAKMYLLDTAKETHIMYQVLDHSKKEAEKLAESLWEITEEELLDLMEKIFKLENIRKMNLGNTGSYKGNISFDVAYINKKLYVDEQAYVLMEWYKDNVDIKLINNSNYIWFGRISGIALYDKIINKIDTTLYESFGINECRIKTLKIEYNKFERFNKLDINNSNIGELNIKLFKSSMFIIAHTSKIGKMIIDLREFCKKEFIAEDTFPISAYTIVVDEINEIEVIIDNRIKQLVYGDGKIDNFEKIISADWILGKIESKELKLKVTLV